MGWNKEGPTIAETPKTIEYIDIAVANWSFVTNFAIIDDLEGMSIANNIPVMVDISINIIGFITLKKIKNPVNNVIIENKKRVLLKIFNLLYFIGDLYIIG